jgi:hypothetical protein
MLKPFNIRALVFTRPLSSSLKTLSRRYCHGHLESGTPSIAMLNQLRRLDDLYTTSRIRKNVFCLWMFEMRRTPKSASLLDKRHFAFRRLRDLTAHPRRREDVTVIAVTVANVFSSIPLVGNTSLEINYSIVNIIVVLLILVTLS